MNAKELYAYIRSLTAQMDDEEKRGSMMKQKKRVFNPENRIDIDLSCIGHIFYNISHDEIKFSIYSHHREL